MLPAGAVRIWNPPKRMGRNRSKQLNLRPKSRWPAGSASGIGAPVCVLLAQKKFELVLTTDFRRDGRPRRPLMPLTSGGGVVRKFDANSWEAPRPSSAARRGSCGGALGPALAARRLAQTPERSDLERGASSTPPKRRRWRGSCEQLHPPSDSDTPEGGSAVYIDRQLAGAGWTRPVFYLSPPFIKGTKQQGPQTQTGPAVQYRKALAASTNIAAEQKGGPFASLSDTDKDATSWRPGEHGAVKLDGVDGQAFLETLPQKHARGIFRRPDLRRQPRHVRLAHDQLPRPSTRDWVHRPQ